MPINVLVTGAGGFIGKHLCLDLLARGYDVTGFDKTAAADGTCRMIVGDIRDPHSVSTAVGRVDCVVHLAGLVGTDYLNTRPAEAVGANIIGALNVFEAAQGSGAHVVNIGLVPNWLNPYMITKKAAARFGEMYSVLHGANIVTLEFTHVYGPGQPISPYRKAIPTFINRALRNEPLDVHGCGRRRMDCVYVTDAVQALRMAVETPQLAGRVLEVSTGLMIRVDDLAHRIRSMSGSTSAIEYVPMRQGEPNDDCDDISPDRRPLFNSLVPWNPQVSLDEGLRRTIDGYRIEMIDAEKVLAFAPGSR